LQTKFVHTVEGVGEKYGKASYDRHVYYVDFPEEGSPVRPMWFSVIRDPVEKYISRFNYLRKAKFRVKTPFAFANLAFSFDRKARILI